MDNILINKLNYDCPICEKLHEIQLRQEKRLSLVKGEKIECLEKFFYCPISNEEFVNGELMDSNLLCAIDSYRKMHNLLTSEEIKEIRNKYNLSQKDFSLILGWGEVTVLRYEVKSIQDQTYDYIIRLFNEDLNFALERLESAKDKISNEKYESVKKQLIEEIKLNANLRLNEKELKNIYLDFNKENEFNGYTLLDINKLKNIIAFFAHNVKGLFLVKLMKLLWYCDVRLYLKSGKSITGLVYQNMPLGALPKGYRYFTNFDTVIVEDEVFLNCNKGISIKPNPDIKLDLSCLTSDEISIINEIANAFKNHTGSQLSELMHQEDAYKKTKTGELIPFNIIEKLKGI